MADRLPKFYKGFPAEKVESVKAGIRDPENRYAKLLNMILDEADPGYAKKLIMAIGFEAAFCGNASDAQ